MRSRGPSAGVSGAGPAKGIRNVVGPARCQRRWVASANQLVRGRWRLVRPAIAEGAEGLDDVIVLGPTEEPFGELVDLRLRVGEAELVRGHRPGRHRLADQLCAAALRC